MFFESRSGGLVKEEILWLHCKRAALISMIVVFLSSRLG